MDCVICGNTLVRNQKKTCSTSCRGKYTRSFVREPWNKGKTGVYSEESLQKMRNGNLGKHLSPKTQFTSKRVSEMWANQEHRDMVREKISASKKGVPFSDEHKKNMRGPRPHARGENSPSWKGGVNYDRRCPSYREWQKSVFKRDDYTCRWCGKRGGGLNAHHVEKFSENVSARYDVNNGVTLCLDCHNKTKGKEYKFTEYFSGLFGTSNKLGTAT